jgi:hypothetical protein
MARRPPPGEGRDAQIDPRVLEERRRAEEEAGDQIVDAPPEPASGTPLDIDGVDHPAHERGVSVRTPEIVTVFDYLPMFNNSNPPVTSRGGKLFDVQVNARRIRIQQLYALLEDLSKDPNSATAKIVEQLKAEMVSEMKGAQNDFILYRSIHDAFYGFLSSFDLRAREDELQTIMQNIRDQRNTRSDPRLINTTITEVPSFTDLMLQNHGFTDRLIEFSSNTKLLYYVMRDIQGLLSEGGPSYISRVISTRPTISESPFSFLAIPERLPRNERFGKVFFPERLDVEQGLIYHRGRLGLSLWIQNEEDAGNRFDLGESLGFYETEEEVGTILGDDPEAVSMLLSTALKDISISSGINNPDYEGLDFEGNPSQAILTGFPTGRSSTNILEYPANLSSEGLNIAKATKADPPVTSARTRPTPLFDPNLTETPRDRQILNVKEILVDSILNTAAGEQFDFSTIQDAIGDIGILSDIAQAIDTLLALNNPDLDPEIIFRKILTAFTSCLERLNPVLSPEGYNDGDFLDLALLSECTKNLDVEGKFPETNGGNGDTSYTRTIIPMIDLINVLLYKIGSSDGYYSNVSLTPGAPIRYPASGFRDEEDRDGLQTPNVFLKDNVENQITNYLLSRFDHYDNFFQPKSLAGVYNYIDPLGFQNPEGFAGVYYAKFNGSDRGLAATEEDDMNLVRYHSNDDGYWNVRNSNTLHSPEGSNNQAKLMGREKILNSLRDAVGGNRLSIFKDIVNILNDVDAAAMLRSEYFEFDNFSERKHMKYSSVDTSVIGSFILQCFSIISRVLTTVTFNEAAKPRVDQRGNQDDYQGAYVWIKTQDRQQIENFKEDLLALRSEGFAAIDNFSETNKAFIGQVLSDLRADRKLLIDGVDLMRSIVSLASDSASDFISTLRSDSPAGRLIQEQKGKLVSIVDPSQQALARNKYEEVTSRLQNNQLFDPFLQSKDAENAILSFGRTDEMFREGFGDNLKILAVGIPDGFSRSVLDYNLLSNNPSHRRTKVRVKVHRHDILLNNTMLRFGESPPGRERDGNEQFRITFKPKEFDFDLRLFFKGLSPIVNVGQDIRVTQLDNDGNTTESPRIIDDRRFVDFSSLIQGNFILRRFDDKVASFNDVTFPFIGTSQDKSIFTNHAFDHIAKSYLRAMTGSKIYEETFLIDREKEQLMLAPEEIARFLELVNEYVGSISGGANVNDYLAGSRATRELLNRLQGNQPTIPIVESVLITNNGLSDDVNVKLTEDIIRFTKMISPDSLLFGPTTTRQRMIEPKLFERVFCMFIDPDSFEIDDIDPAFKNRLIEAGLIQPNIQPVVLSQITNLMEVPQFNQFYVEVI